jgi:hypothetical protein
VRLGFIGFAKAVPSVKFRSAIQAKDTEANRNACGGRLVLELTNHGGAYSTALVAGRNYEFPEMDVFVSVLDRAVPARLSFVEYDRLRWRIPLGFEEAILRRLVPRSELTFDDLAVCTVMRSTSELLIGVLGRTEFYHSDRSMLRTTISRRAMLSRRRLKAAVKRLRIVSTLYAPGAFRTRVMGVWKRFS